MSAARVKAVAVRIDKIAARRASEAEALQRDLDEVRALQRELGEREKQIVALLGKPAPASAAPATRGLPSDANARCYDCNVIVPVADTLDGCPACEAKPFEGEVA